MSEGKEKIVSAEEHHEMTHGRPKPKQVTLPIYKILAIGGVLVLCIVSFSAGVAYQKNHTPKSTYAFPGSQMMNGGGSTRIRSGGFGQVTAVSASSISLASPRDNSTKTYTIDSSTSISNNGQTIAITDVKVGDSVIVQASNSDATIAARILVNPNFGPMSDSTSSQNP